MRDLIERTPLGNEGVAKNICKILLTYLKRDTCSLKESQLGGLLQNHKYAEFMAIWFLYIAADMPEKNNRLDICDNEPFEEGTLPVWYHNISNALDNRDYFDELSIKIYIKSDSKKETHTMVSNFKYTTSYLVAPDDNSNKISYKFTFENRQLAEKHKLNQLIINDTDITNKGREPYYFYENAKKYCKKLYIFDNIEHADTYEIKRVCTSYLNFPIGELTYHLPKYTKKLSIKIELEDDLSPSIGLFRLEGAVFAQYP